MLHNEMKTLMSVNHPFLCGIVDAFKHQNKICLIMPLMPRNTPGCEPDLMSWLMNTRLSGTRCSEDQAATIVHHTAVAIK
jgi:hypothetical protein